MPPITPDKIQKPIPEEVFDAFNELIAQDYDGREAIVKIEGVKRLIKAKLLAADKEFKDWMLEIENSYRKTKKWTVEYDGPCIGDSYEGFYKFTKKGK